MKSIICLFSIENNYDQPKNNLEAWWENFPSREKVVKILGRTDVDETAEQIDKLMGGEEVRIGGSDYRLEEVFENKLLD